MLKRLVKSLESWESSKSLGMRVMFGSPDISVGSPAFEEWHNNTRSAIVLIFGEYSHFVADFDEVEFSNLYTALLQNKSAKQKKFWEGVGNVKILLHRMIEEIEQGAPQPAFVALPAQQDASAHRKVFLGHGRNPLWRALKSFLEDDCGLAVVCFESEARASEPITSVLEKMLTEAGFAIILLTGEDMTTDGHVRARQNVIHEVGLAHGKLGLSKVVILKQDGVEEVSNLAGLQYISFGDRIEHAFYDLGKKLKREGLV
jgi:predicted nucleotide-binding protein